jgi:hypothetical protein
LQTTNCDFTSPRLRGCHTHSRDIWKLPTHWHVDLSNPKSAQADFADTSNDGSTVGSMSNFREVSKNDRIAQPFSRCWENGTA